MSAQRGVLADLRRISAQLSHYDDSARLWCPTLDAAAAAVAELVEAAEYMSAYFHKDSTVDQVLKLRAALARMDPQPGEQP